MNRRRFGLLSGTSLLAVMGAGRPIRALAAADPQLLTTTLTPLGAERAGNAAGTIPAWTGGFNTPPAGWNGDSDLLIDFFASDTILYTVNASNLSQYASLLSEGAKFEIQNAGMAINVYQTRRTASAPQWVYDNTAANIKTAQLNPAGGRLGFSGGFGGTPFPIPDISDAETAGGQIFWNMYMRWWGQAWRIYSVSWTVENGSKQITGASEETYEFPYYSQSMTLATFNGQAQDTHEVLTGPSTLIGEEIVTRYSTTPYQVPNITWELLPGQSRVRKTPELSYDTPNSTSDGVINYDESTVFSGSPDEYDWKYLGKQEMLIPYNCQKVPRLKAADVVGEKFINPESVRWELHRVWVVEATLHPGKRNVLARRRFYLDEDSWWPIISDNYDANNNLYHWDVNWLAVYPNLPGLFTVLVTGTNVQTGDYTVFESICNDPPLAGRPVVFGSQPDSYFQPQAMAANASY
jgi:hypothetical protein